MDRKTIYVNSSQRDIGGTDDNFNITRVVKEFPFPPKSVKLLTASIPFTWGNVVNSNNTFTIDEFGSGTDSFTINSGVYTGNELASKVESLINGSFILTPTYTVVFNSNTKLFTFANPTEIFQVIFATLGSAASLLGFVPATSNPGGPAISVTSTTPAVGNTVSSGNNTFSINQVGPITDSFIIATGNYNGTTLATAVQSLLNGSSILTPSFTVVFDSTTLLFTFTNSTSAFQITFKALGSAASLLGFTPGSTPAAPELSFTSSSAKLLPDYEIFICSDLVKGSDNGDMLWYPSYTPTLTNQSQILARVPINGCYSSIINYSAHVQLPFYNVAQSVFAKAPYTAVPAAMNFFLARPSGLPINLGGYHWSCELVFDFNVTGSI